MGFMATRRTSEFLRLAEIPRAGFEIASLMAAAPWMTLSPRGEKHPVVVIPGFLADDDSTRVLRAYLDHLDRLIEDRENQQYLPGASFPDSLVIEPDVAAFEKIAKPVVAKYAAEKCRPGILEEIAKYAE